MSKTNRILWSASVALLALVAFQASARATTYSIRVFNPDGTQISSEKVTLEIKNVNGQGVATYNTTTGVYLFTVNNTQPTNNVSVTFIFTRAGSGSMHTISGICVSPASPPTKTMDVVLP